jgi:hypothetical protein
METAMPIRETAMISFTSMNILSQDMGTDLQDPATSLGSWGLGDFNDDKRKRMCAVGR